MDPMTTKRGRAKDVARKRAGYASYWIDHAEIVDDDYEWLGGATHLTLWNVHIPLGFLSRLERLWWVDIRGGSAENLEVLQGASAVQYLSVNQIRGLRDLSVVTELANLRFLNLYGLRNVTAVPSLAPLRRLRKVTLGQMRGLESIAGVLDAAHLQELEFVRRVIPTEEDVRRIANHPTLQRFGWFPEDVPDRIFVPIMDRIKLPRVQTLSPEAWFAQN
jgi:hypothetical protein